MVFSFGLGEGIGGKGGGGKGEVRRYTFLHFGDEIFVEETPGLLMQRAIDGHDIALRQHLLQILNASASNLLLQLRLKGLIIKIQQLLAIKRFQPPQNAFTDATDGHGADDFVLEIVFAFGDGGDVPIALCDLFVGGDEVADEDEDGHDDVFGDGDDVGAGDFGDGDAAIGFVGGVEVDVVGADASGNGEFELLGFGETFGGEVARVEARDAYISCDSLLLLLRDERLESGAVIGVTDENSRGGYDDLRIDQFLIEGGVFALLIGSRHQGMTLLLEPFANPEFVLGGSE